MWFSFWRSSDRFTLDELRYLTEQLQKIQVVNEVNKGFVVEALRSIAELVTYGDQHDSSFFEFFMEKQIMGEFVRILKVSKITNVPLQLLQTMSIMIQNLRSEHAIYYIFSNEHINSLIMYSFDFQNEELLSYYISFLRAISGKLNRNTISLLVKAENEEVTSFPLYTEAIRFAFHEENMVRIAVRALTLNVYHVGDENVNKYVSSAPLSDYFSNLVSHFQKQCINLDRCVCDASRNPQSSDGASSVITGFDEIEDSLYYFSDVISAGVPELGRLITENILQLLIFPMLLPALKELSQVSLVGATTSLYLLCCILNIVKTKELAGTIATALFCPLDCFLAEVEVKPNGSISKYVANEDGLQDDTSSSVQVNKSGLEVFELNSPGEGLLRSYTCSSSSHGSQLSLRELLLSFIIHGNDVEVLGSLNLLATLLQTKELDESMLDGLGILPERKQHRKLLLQALVGEGSGEEKLFSPENSLTKDCINTELDRYVQNFMAKGGFSFCCGESRVIPQVHRKQVLNSLVSLFCRPNISAPVLWAGGWLLRQLFPHSEAEFCSQHMKRLKDSHSYSVALLLEETKRNWSDQLLPVLIDEWRNCKKAIEASTPQKDLKRIFLPFQRKHSEGESSFAAGGRMCETVKVFVLRHQLLILYSGGVLSDLLLVNSPSVSTLNSRAKVSGMEVLIPKPGTEIFIAEAIPCRIAFERGKERHFSFLAVSRGTSGWVLLVDELPLKPQYGVIRVAAPLAGSNPNIDDKHQKWLHLRIRPSTLPGMDPSKSDASTKGKAKVVVDGRWILAFRDEQACKSAESMILEEMHLQSSEVEKRVKAMLDLV